MNKVIEYCNLIAANTNLAIDSYYWDNFKWDNGSVSSENIFVRKPGGDARAGNGANLKYGRTCSKLALQPSVHQAGMVSLRLSQFYDSFEGNDVRKSDTLSWIH
jgi:hypothetical protein